MYTVYATSGEQSQSWWAEMSMQCSSNQMLRLTRCHSKEETWSRTTDKCKEVTHWTKFM